MTEQAAPFRFDQSCKLGQIDNLKIASSLTFDVEDLFRRLTVEQRAVFVLHHYLGLPLVEVAELLEIPAGTARSRLHYAIAGLRDAIEAEREPVIQEGRLA